MTTQTILMIIFAVGWGICEGLASIPGIKANSTFQLIFQLFSSLTGKKPD